MSGRVEGSQLLYASSVSNVVLEVTIYSFVMYVPSIYIMCSVRVVIILGHLNSFKEASFQNYTWYRVGVSDLEKDRTTPRNLNLDSVRVIQKYTSLVEKN